MGNEDEKPIDNSHSSAQVEQDRSGKVVMSAEASGRGAAAAASETAKATSEAGSVAAAAKNAQAHGRNTEGILSKISAAISSIFGR